MPSITDTIARLAKARAAAALAPDVADDRLTELPDFGSNPGALRGWMYVPPDRTDVRALVVVLHGCTQTARSYDAGAGWSALADRHGFALLFPEQQRRNNPNLCFNWFAPDHARRGRSEALSIRQMVAAALARHRLDPARVYITGLSAGGAMAAVMLAAYPELFAGGAIIAGLPYGCAGDVPRALERMRGQGLPDADTLTRLARDASPHDGPWPVLSVWHGGGDATVNVANAEAIVGQWRGLHGLGRAPSRTETVEGHPRRVWCDASGRDVIEQYSIAGMGHGTPIDTRGADGVGAAGPFMLEAGISSSARICRFWGLAEAAPKTAAVPAPPPADRPRPRPTPIRAEPVAPRPAPAAGGVAKIIEDALRKAGLMR